MRSCDRVGQQCASPAPAGGDSNQTPSPVSVSDTDHSRSASPASQAQRATPRRPSSPVLTGGNVAVLAIHAARPTERRTRRAPEARRRALLDCLHPAGGVDDRPTFRVECAEAGDFLGRKMPGEVGEDLTGMQGERPYTTRSAASVEPEGEERIRRLGLPVGGPLVVAARQEVDVVKVDAGDLMPAGRHGDDTGALFGEEARDRRSGGNAPGGWWRTVPRGPVRRGTEAWP